MPVVLAGRPHLVPADIFRHHSPWREVSREEALSLRARHEGWTIVVYRNGGAECADWLDDGHPYARGVLPHALRHAHARYYRWREVAPRVETGGGGEAAATPSPSPPPATERTRTSPTKTWIEIELLDDAGKPVANAKYAVRLPDKSTRRGTLDAKGLARFDNIDPGSCEVSFPEIDAKEWGPK